MMNNSLKKSTNHNPVFLEQRAWRLVSPLWLIISVLSLTIIISSLGPRYHELLVVSDLGYGPTPWQLQATDQVALAQFGLTIGHYAAWLTFWEGLSALVVFGVGVVLYLRGSHQLCPYLFSLALITYGLNNGPMTNALEHSHFLWTFTVPLFRAIARVLFITAFLVFPDGRFIPRWTRWLTLGLIVYVIAALFQPTLEHQADLSYRIPIQWLPLLVGISVLVVIVVTSVYRYRYVSTQFQQQQTKWVVFSTAVIVVVDICALMLMIYLSLQAQPTTIGVRLLLYSVILMGGIFFALGVSVALLRHQLFQIDLLINRTLVYSGLTVLISFVYVILVGGGGFISANQSGAIGGFFFASLLLAMVFRPAYTALQSIANRLVPISDPLSKEISPVEQTKTQHRITDNHSGFLHRHSWHFSGRHFIVGFVAVVLISWLIFGMAPLRYRMLLADPYGLGSGFLALGLSPISFALYFTTLELIPAIVFLIVAAFIVWQQFENRFAQLVAVSFALNALLFPLADGFIFAYPQWTLVLSALRVSTVIVIVAVQCMFPTGQFVPKWTFWLWLCWSIGWSVSLFLNPAVLADLALLATIQTMDDAQGILLGMGGVVIAIIGQIVRYHHHATALEKQQIKWLLFGFVMTIMIAFSSVLLLISFPAINDPSRNGLLFIMVMGGAILLSFLCIPVAIAVSILRYRLWNIDFYLNRTLVYGALTTIVLGIYALLISGLGLVFHSRNNIVASLLATGIIAVLFQPVRSWLQSHANRWLFGERDDPAGVLTKLTSQLEQVDSSDSLLDTLVKTIATSLKLPYVALWLDGKAGEFNMTAETGNRPTRVEMIPLLHQQERVGQLEVAPRSPGETLSQADLQLLAAIARLTATTARTIQLTDEVQEARVRTVAARAEERRRLRRDLHDGLGPVLASQGLKLAAARQLLRDKPDVAEQLLDEVINQSANTVGEVRHLVYALRPPTLDELGLVGAIREQVEMIGAGTKLTITVDAPSTVHAIPAAIEVAAFRIIQEALNNVSRHAQARHCTIKIHLDGALSITVRDDGIGLSATNKPGVGLYSMRERAAEVGGSCDIANGEAGGVTVHLRLPLGNGE